MTNPAERSTEAPQRMHRRARRALFPVRAALTGAVLAFCAPAFAEPTPAPAPAAAPAPAPAAKKEEGEAPAAKKEEGEAPAAKKEEGKAPAKAPPTPPEAEAPTSPKRAVPDYTGREEPTTAGDVALWVPRVIFFPAYVVTEYVVRWPLGVLVRAAEHGRWVQQLADLFTFGPNKNIGIVPTGLIDFGVRPSVGLYFFYDDLGFKGNDFRVHAATGGSNWYRLTVADRVEISDRSYVKLRGEASIRPDWIFAGIGPESLERNQSRYLARSLEGGLSFYHAWKGASSVETYTNVKTVGFGDGTCCDEPTLRKRVAEGAFDVPPGFEEGYTASRTGLRLALDSRSPRTESGSGARLELGSEYGFNIEDVRSRWIRYGAAVTGYLDLTGHNRVLSLGVTTAFTDPLSDKEMPFTELISLGGQRPMRGFREDRLLGRSAAVATLEYRYPIWAFLDGSLEMAAGNVFSEHLRDFSPDLLRLSWTVGVKTAGDRDHSLDALMGIGTETFRQGARLDEIRFLLGATRRF